MKFPLESFQLNKINTKLACLIITFYACFNKEAGSGKNLVLEAEKFEKLVTPYVYACFNKENGFWKEPSSGDQKF